MSLWPKLRGVLAFTLLVLLTSPTWAEYCKSQGSPAVPKSQTPPFDAQALLSAAEIQQSEQRHLPWGRPECLRDLQLTRYGDEGWWWATFFLAGREHSLTSDTASAWDSTAWRAVQRAALGAPERSQEE